MKSTYTNSVYSNNHGSHTQQHILHPPRKQTLHEIHNLPWYLRPIPRHHLQHHPPQHRHLPPQRTQHRLMQTNHPRPNLQGPKSQNHHPQHRQLCLHSTRPQQRLPPPIQPLPLPLLSMALLEPLHHLPAHQRRRQLRSHPTRQKRHRRSTNPTLCGSKPSTTTAAPTSTSTSTLYKT